ncbi:MAG: DUF420 domain-containing protein [Opitutus sp.]|nr:DUF420 domain-containing protein [Opitutus sp.]
MNIDSIPTFNAVCNAIATVLLLAGFVFIQRRDERRHRLAMLSAGAASLLFLAGYLTHKALLGGVHTPFAGPPLARNVYLFILVSHSILAAAIAVLVPRTFYLGLRGDRERHRRWARLTFPIWLYVSATGVLIYLFLYAWWPRGA